MTIAIPVYNGASYISRVVTSALSQDYEDIRVLIADNASSDGTSDLAADFARSDSRICHARLPELVGLRENWNRCIEASETAYFKWAPHDDWFAPDFVSRSMAAIRSDEHTLASYTRALFLTPDGRLFGGTDDRGPGLVGHSRERRFHRAMWRVRYYPAVTAGVIRRDVVSRIRLRENIEPIDKLHAIERALMGNVRLVPEPLLFITKELGHLRKNEWVYNDSANATRSRRRSRRTHDAFVRAFKRHELSRTELALVYPDMALRYLTRVLAPYGAGSSPKPDGSASLEEKLRQLVGAVPASAIEVPDRIRSLLDSP